MTDSEFYLALADLFSEEGHWCKGWLARDVFGREVDPGNNNNKVHSMCLAGGIMHLTQYADDIYDCSSDKYTRYSYYSTEISRHLNQMGKSPIISRFNDDPETTHADILQVINELAVEAKERKNQ